MKSVIWVRGRVDARHCVCAESDKFAPQPPAPAEEEDEEEDEEEEEEEEEEEKAAPRAEEEEEGHEAGSGCDASWRRDLFLPDATGASCLPPRSLLVESTELASASS